MTGNGLIGKHALIAGSTQGIGLAIAQQLAGKGVNCTLISRNVEKLKAAVSSLSQTEQQHHNFLVADFSDYKVVQAVVADYVKNKAVSILINNTGGPPAGPIFTAQPEEFLKAFQQHLICNQLLAQTVVPGMKQTGYGRIVNIVSTSVKIPIKNLGVSNTIRGAVASWAKTMSNELAPFGITVNNVLPGATATVRLKNLVDNKTAKTGLSKERVEESMLAAIPMGRFAQPSEIAAVAVFLASPEASYLTGVSIPVDGGRTGCL